MLESGSSGSVRGVPSNGHPYREPRPFPVIPETDRVPPRRVMGWTPPDGICVPR
jgi:hypothetical protein